MVSRSSREARSAKREALRNALVDRKLGSGRVAKSTKSKCKVATKKASKPNSNKSFKVGLQESTEDSSKDSSKDRSKDSSEDNSEDVPKDSPNDILQETSITPEDVHAKSTSSSGTTDLAPLSPVAELQKASAFSSEHIIDLPAEFTDDLAPFDTDVDNLTSFEELSKRYLDTPSPMSPVSPIDEKKLCEPPIMSDEELQTYLQEFEAVSSGADVPGATDSDYSDVSSMPVSPLLDEARYMQDTRAPSPLCYTPDSVDDAVFEPVSQEELKIDDYFNFINIADTSSDSVSFAAEDTAPKRKVPFCVYQARNDVHPVSSTFNPQNRTLLAAWQTMAPDVQFGTRDAYVRAVLLAAASLTQRSLISGRARETMAPALGTSH